MWPFRKAPASPGPAETRSAENPRVPLSDPAVLSIVMPGAMGSGDPLTHETALSIPAVWCAINFLSNTIAALPLKVYRNATGGKEVYARDPAYSILHDAINDEWSSAKWRKYAMTNALLRGRSCTFVERDAAGRLINLWPLPTVKTTVVRRAGRTTYHYVEDGKEIVYQAGEIIDIVWMLEDDGVTHVDPVARLNKAFRLTSALSNYADRFFDNGGVPPLALTGPLNSAAAAKRASDDVTQAIVAAQRDRRNVLALPTGHDLKAIGLDPDKSQMEGGRRFQVEETARIYGLPPVFLQDLTHGTFSNTEQQDLQLAKHTVNQWTTCWQQEMNLKLYGRGRRDRFAEFNLDGLMRGDFATRMAGYATAIQNGVMAPNEAREAENRPAKAGGDALMIQGATVPITSQPGQGQEGGNNAQA